MQCASVSERVEARLASTMLSELGQGRRMYDPRSRGATSFPDCCGSAVRGGPLCKACTCRTDHLDHVQIDHLEHVLMDHLKIDHLDHLKACLSLRDDV